MIMEGASVTALTIGRARGEERMAAIAELDIAGKRIKALLAAVQSLVD
jgi:hypothetical protein